REHLQVAGGGGRAVEGPRPDRRAAHDLAERRGLEVREPGTAPALREEEVPEAALARLRLQLLDDRGDPPARRLRVELVVEDLLVRVDVLVHEVRELLHVHLRFLRVLEFHVGPPLALARSRLYPPAGPFGTAPGGGGRSRSTCPSRRASPARGPSPDSASV